MKKSDVDRFKSAKYSAETHPELLSVMSKNSFSLYQLCNVLGLTSGGSAFCRLGIEVSIMHARSVEMVKNADRSFDQATKLAMISPYFEEEKITHEDLSKT